MREARRARPGVLRVLRPRIVLGIVLGIAVGIGLGPVLGPALDAASGRAAFAQTAPEPPVSGQSMSRAPRPDPAAAAGRAIGRTALVIDNAVARGDPVPPAPDTAGARAVGEALVDRGFAQRALIDASRAQMRDAVARTAQRARDGVVALAYLAGRFEAPDGRPLLLGADADQQREPRERGLLVDEAAAALTGAGLGVLFIDAGSALPIPGHPSRRPGVVFVLVDGSGADRPGSALAEALARRLREPDVAFDAMLRQISWDLAIATDGAQVLRVIGDLPRGIAIDGRRVSSPAAFRLDPETERVEWRLVLAGGPTERDLRDFLIRRPNGRYAGQARARLAELVPPDRLLTARVEALLALLEARGEGERVAAGLTAIGLLAPGDAASTLPESMRLHLADQRGATDPEKLYTIAARRLTERGAEIGRSLATGMIALESIARAEAIAREAYEELLDLSRSRDPDAESIEDLVAEAEEDLARIADAGARVRAQIDATGEAYAQLLEETRAHFADYIPDCPGPGCPAIDGEDRDVLRFVAHVREGDVGGGGDGGGAGSHAWIADFLPTRL